MINFAVSFREWRIKVKSEGLRVKSEEWRISYRGPKEDSENGAQAIRLKTELKQFVWNGTQVIRLKRNSSNSSEDKERKVKLMFN